MLRYQIYASTVLLALFFLIGACSPSEQTAKTSSNPDVVIPPPPADTGSGETGLHWVDPAGWEAHAPESSMRKAQYRVDGPGGRGQCLVFYFGPGQGGDPLANAQRWAHQFKASDGSAAFEALDLSELEGSLLPVRIVEVHGTYQGSMGSGPGEEKANYMLLGAIVDGPDAPWFFKFTGPEDTVEDQREAFLGMMRSIRAGS